MREAVLTATGPQNLSNSALPQGDCALVIVPTYNERDNIIELIARIRAALPNADVLIVDDGSQDRTADWVSRIAATDPHVALLQIGRREGQGAAYYAGFRLGLRGQYKYFIQMDGDLSHDPSCLPHLLGSVASGADIALGSRYVAEGSVREWPRSRRLISWIGNRYLKWLSGAAIADFTTGFRCLRRQVVANTDLTHTPAIGNVFLIEAIMDALRARRDIREIPITYTGRTRGRSKFRWRCILGALRAATPLVALRLRIIARRKQIGA